MAGLPGYRGQPSKDHLFDASGTITTGGTPQLILPQQYIRSSLIITNISAYNMYFEVGGARATAGLGSGTTAGTVTSITLTNAGMGYSRPPKVIFFGGYLAQTTALTFTLPSTADFPAPSLNGTGRVAQAHCVMTGSAGSQTISSIVIDDPGAGYIMPPLVFLENDPTDPFGCASPYYSSTASGIELLPQGSYTPNGSICTTDAVAVYCATSAAAFTVKYSL